MLFLPKINFLQLKILYFYPENPLLKIQGNNARANKLLDYFKTRNFDVDFVGEKGSNFTDQDADILKKNKNLNKVFLLKGLDRKKNQLKYLFLSSIPKRFRKGNKLMTRLRFGQKQEFQKILKANSYNFIIISYAYWSELLDNNKNVKNAKLIIDTHDFLTSQFQNSKHFSLGSLFEEEISILKNFDEVFVISNEEKYVFSQFLDNNVTIITHALEDNFNLSSNEKEYDLIYVASDNGHNINGAKWFLVNVYPLLSTNIKMLVIGKITDYFPDLENVTKIRFVDDLNEMYSKSKIAICPMLTGTGVKIKVIEALSFGLPIVCNERGVDGLLNKTNNGCLVANNPDKFVENINVLLSDLEFYNKISLDGQSFFKENHNIEQNYKILDTIFENK